MLVVERKKFGAMEFKNGNEEIVRIEEGMEVTITMNDSGEIVYGRVIKLQSKELILHVDGEDFDRLLSFSDFAEINQGIDEEC